MLVFIWLEPSILYMVSIWRFKHVYANFACCVVENITMALVLWVDVFIIFSICPYCLQILLTSRIFMPGIKFIRYMGFTRWNDFDGCLGWDELLGMLELVIAFLVFIMKLFLLLELGWVCFSLKPNFVNYLYVRNRFY